MGYKKDYDGVWLTHQDNFDDLLSQLKQTSDETAKPVQEESLKSLEEHSKNSRARVHYRKFTKSKDLTNATQNDLDCILGRHKRPSKNEKQPIQEEDNESSESSGKEVENVAEDKSSFKTITNKLSINDYFASKMALLKKRKIEDDSVAVDGVPEESSEETCGKKKKKKKKSKSDGEVVSIDEPEQTVQQHEVNEEPVQVDTHADSHVKKKKKKKKSVDEIQTDEVPSDNEVILVNSNDDSAPVAVDTEECKKKKKKKKKEKTAEQADDVIEITQNGAETTGKTRFDLPNPFEGSNLFDINGYTPYAVTHKINELLDEKEKISKKKLSKFSKTVVNNPEIYISSRKPAINPNLNKS
jgi:Pin2-interacting protein X1